MPQAEHVAPIVFTAYLFDMLATLTLGPTILLLFTDMFVSSSDDIVGPGFYVFVLQLGAFLAAFIATPSKGTIVLIRSISLVVACVAYRGILIKIGLHLLPLIVLWGFSTSCGTLHIKTYYKDHTPRSVHSTVSVLFESEIMMAAIWVMTFVMGENLWAFSNFCGLAIIGFILQICATAVYMLLPGSVFCHAIDRSYSLSPKGIAWHVAMHELTTGAATTAVFLHYLHHCAMKPRTFFLISIAIFIMGQVVACTSIPRSLFVTRATAAALALISVLTATKVHAHSTDLLQRGLLGMLLSCVLGSKGHIEYNEEGPRRLFYGLGALLSGFLFLHLPGSTIARFRATFFLTFLMQSMAAYGTLMDSSSRSNKAHV